MFSFLFLPSAVGIGPQGGVRDVREGDEDISLVRRLDIELTSDWDGPHRSA